MQSELVDLSAGNLSVAFWAAVVVSVVLPLFPHGKKLLYPFALMGTWAHEGGHGMAAILAGGKFKSLEIYSNLGGVAYSTGIGRRAQAFVAAGGLLGPAIAGGAIIVLSSKEELAPWVLAGLSALLIVSALLFIRNRFGFTAIVILGLLLAGLTVYGDESVRIFLAQLVGIQFCVASWNTVDYMFTKHFFRNGKQMNSDTQDIAEALFLPYWFWATGIVLISIAILAVSYYIAWIR